MCSVSVSVSNHILHTVGRVSIDLHMLTTWICPEGQHHGWQHFLGMMSALKFLPRKPGLPEIFSFTAKEDSSLNIQKLSFLQCRCVKINPIEGQHHGWQHFLAMMSALNFLPRKPGIFSQIKKNLV